MVGRGRVSRGSLGAVFLVGIFLFLFLGIVRCQTRQTSTITVRSTTSFGFLKSIGKHGRRSHFRLSYVSKRRVPNGPDPIHNRRAGQSTQPPNRV